MRMQRYLATLLHAALFIFAAAVHASPVPLPAFRLDLAQTTVSGLSSGAFMAVQFGVAHSSIVKGVGAIAGGPYYCAQGELDIATSKCSCTGLFTLACDAKPGGTSLPALYQTTARYARTGRIDPIAKLAGQRIWLFSGSKDDVVPPAVMQDLLTRYPDINIVFGQDDPMALGALQAIKANGAEGIKVFGVNGNKDACDAIKAGDMYGTAMQLSYLVGVYTVRAAYDITQGRQVPAKILAPTAPVTPDNVDKLYDQCW